MIRFGDFLKRLKVKRRTMQNYYLSPELLATARCQVDTLYLRACNMLLDDMANAEDLDDIREALDRIEGLRDRLDSLAE